MPFLRLACKIRPQETTKHNQVSNESHSISAFLIKVQSIIIWFQHSTIFKPRKLYLKVSSIKYIHVPCTYLQKQFFFSLCLAKNSDARLLEKGRWVARSSAHRYSFTKSHLVTFELPLFFGHCAIEIVTRYLKIFLVSRFKISWFWNERS